MAEIENISNLDFVFEGYNPGTFRQIRELQGISDASYLVKKKQSFLFFLYQFFHLSISNHLTHNHLCVMHNKIKNFLKEGQEVSFAVLLMENTL